MSLVEGASIVVAIVFVLIAIFQVFLALGYPLGEYAMGGFYKIFPMKLRVVSALNAIILFMMSFVFFQYSGVIEGISSLPVGIIVWVITIYLGLNTLANLFSKSKKERFVMTPLSGVTFLLCLFIALS